jgi:septum formation protein
MSELILASTSHARRTLMDALGVGYRAVAPSVDEDVPEGTPVQEAVAMLSLRKARAVAARYPKALVLGSDQLVACDGRAFGKPENAEAARAQIARITGRTHEIMTAVTLLGPQFSQTEVDVAKLTVYPLSEREVDAYVATGEWQGCAGAYRIEGRGQVLFERIEGDRTAIQGLPMLHVISLLRRAGFRFL